MAGRGSGRRGRGGRGGAKRSRDDFEKKPPSTSQPAEPAAPLPGGFKSLKAKWISVYENEKKAQESAPPVRPQSAADTVETKSTAAEPLGAKPQSSAPHSVTEDWRKLHPSEAVKAPDKEDVGSSSKLRSRHAESAPAEKVASMQQPDPSAASPEGVPNPEVEEQSTAALHSSAAPAVPEVPNSTAGGVKQARDRAEKGTGAHHEGVALKQQPTTAQAPQGGSGPGLAPEQPAAKPASASGLGPGRVAAMQDAAATYKAASKAHSSMREALSPKRAEASGRLPAPKAAAAELSRAAGVKATPAALEPSMPSKDAAAQAQQGEAAAVAKPDQAIEAPQSTAEQSGDLFCTGSALKGSAAAGQQKDEEKGESSNPYKIQQPESEIKQKTPVPVDSSAAPLRDAIAPEQKKPSTKERAAGKSGSESGLRQPKQKAQKGPPEGQQGPGLGTKQSAGSDLEQPAQSRSGPDGKPAGQPGQSGQKTGLRASQKAQLDTASRRELKKGLAQTKAAADGSVAKAQDDIKAEDHIEDWKAQNASTGAPPPLQPAPGDAHATEEASRQKGSDASSLERSPDIPHPEQQQQQLADQAEMQGGKDQGEHAMANAKPVTADSQPSQLAPVEYLGEGSSASQQLGQIDLQQFDSYRALWDGLREDYGQSLPEGLHLRLVYEDGEGDFVMLQPDEPWPAFLSSARRVIISCQ